MMTPVRAMIVVATVMVAAPVFVAAQTPEPAPPPYRPGLGDLMTTTVQPRHTKLAIAGREKNWVYAAYELHQLDEAFDRAGAVRTERHQRPQSDRDDVCGHRGVWRACERGR